MKLSRPSAPEAAVLLALLTSATPAAAKLLDCENLLVDGHKFNFWELRGPHSVVTSGFQSPTYTNTTYTIDICRYLERSNDVPANEQCSNGAKVCGIRRLIDPEKKIDTVEAVIPIAGELANHGGSQFDWEATRLKTSTANDDIGKEGVRVTLKGGKHGGVAQQAVVEFRCANMTGTENEWESEDKYVQGPALRSIRGVSGRDDGADSPESTPEQQLKKPDAALIWNGRHNVKDVETLFLTWHTKFACESLSEGDGAPPPKKHWGFFTWLVILIFLGVAAYLIFGSWLNYNRYGARGWDLLPHGDTIRDVPYLLKDWTRRALNTVQGSGSRGGYSAV
ncbi:autophagy-related protein 27 [Thozetella sp. PMI_491]|nr:autophagy-related protein 27 [Thozetella sp. PMI_491]